MILAIVQILYLALDVLFWVIIGQVILSWLFVFNVVNPTSNAVRTISEVLDRITRPIYKPIRKIMPDFGMIDLSPMIVLFGIIIMQRAILPGILAETGATLIN